MIDRKTETRIVGPSRGRVMLRMACQRLAPSICGGLLELAGDALEAGEQDDHVEAEVLPRDDDEQGHSTIAGRPSQGWIDGAEADAQARGRRGRRAGA